MWKKNKENIEPEREKKLTYTIIMIGWPFLRDPRFFHIMNLFIRTIKFKNISQCAKIPFWFVFLFSVLNVVKVYLDSILHQYSGSILQSFLKPYNVLNCFGATKDVIILIKKHMVLIKNIRKLDSLSLNYINQTQKIYTRCSHS